MELKKINVGYITKIVILRPSLVLDRTESALSQPKLILWFYIVLIFKEVLNAILHAFIFYACFLHSLTDEIRDANTAFSEVFF